MNLFVEHVEAWLLLSFVGLLTVFSDKIIGRVRFALNRADLRSKYYEELAISLSSFLFFVDLYHVRLIRGESDFEDVSAIAGEVNGAYVALKTKEYVYRSWVRRYWGAEGISQFESVLNAATNAYDAIIEFNGKGNEEQKTGALGDQLHTLESMTDAWLSKLDA